MSLSEPVESGTSVLDLNFADVDELRLERSTSDKESVDISGAGCGVSSDPTTLHFSLPSSGEFLALTEPP